MNAIITSGGYVVGATYIENDHDLEVSSHWRISQEGKEIDFWSYVPDQSRPLVVRHKFEDSLRIILNSDSPQESSFIQDFSGNWTVWRLKVEMYGETSILPENQRLIFDDVEMQDDLELEDYRLDDDSQLFLFDRKEPNQIKTKGFFVENRYLKHGVLWKSCGIGFNVVGFCENSFCHACDDQVVAKLGYGRFTNSLQGKCPVCSCPFEQKNFIVVQADVAITSQKKSGWKLDREVCKNASFKFFDLEDFNFLELICVHTGQAIPKVCNICYCLIRPGEGVEYNCKHSAHNCCVIDNECPICSTLYFKDLRDFNDCYCKLIQKAREDALNEFAKVQLEEDVFEPEEPKRNGSTRSESKQQRKVTFGR